MWFSLDQVDGRYAPPLRIRAGMFGDLDRRYLRRSEELGEIFYRLHFALIEKLSQSGFNNSEKGEFAMKEATYSCWVPVHRMRFWDEKDAPDPKPKPISNMDAFIRTRCAYARIKAYRKFSPNYSSVDKKLREIVAASPRIESTPPEGKSPGLVFASQSFPSGLPKPGRFSPVLAGWIGKPETLASAFPGDPVPSENLVCSVLAEAGGCMAIPTLVGLLAAAFPGIELPKTVSADAESPGQEGIQGGLSADALAILRAEYEMVKRGFGRLNIDELRVLYLSVPEGQSGCPAEFAIASDQESIGSLAELLDVTEDQVRAWLDQILLVRQGPGVTGMNAAFVGNLLGISPGLVTSRLKEARNKLRRIENLGARP
ncbi:MAG: hypothetical protein JSS71_13280 [Armatimonadetes bacterium]|nr:hypothetical protein [Armatimonadota bacterium]MBX3110227.1 hypothetical protein [Fimbriimonadaceae bacterium]